MQLEAATDGEAKSGATTVVAVLAAEPAHATPAGIPSESWVMAAIRKTAFKPYFDPLVISATVTVAAPSIKTSAAFSVARRALATKLESSDNN